MRKMLQVVEIMWIVIAVLSAYQVYEIWPETNNRFWIFLGFFALAVIMYFIRRRQRLRYQDKQKQKETE